MNLNSKIMGATGIGGAALFIVLASNFKPFIEGITALPALISAFSSQLPFKAGSFLLVQMVAPFLYMFLNKWLPRKHADRHDFVCEAMTLGAAIGAMVAQQWGGRAPEMLSASLLGTLAGLSSPLIVKGFRSLLSKETSNDAARPVEPTKAVPDAD